MAVDRDIGKKIVSAYSSLESLRDSIDEESNPEMFEKVDSALSELPNFVTLSNGGKILFTGDMAQDGIDRDALSAICMVLAERGEDNSGYDIILSGSESDFVNDSWRDGEFYSGKYGKNNYQVLTDSEANNRYRELVSQDDCEDDNYLTDDQIMDRGNVISTDKNRTEIEIEFSYPKQTLYVYIVD